MAAAEAGVAPEALLTGRAFRMEDSMDIFWLIVSMSEEWTISRCERNGGGGGVGTEDDRCPPVLLPAELSSSS